MGARLAVAVAVCTAAIGMSGCASCSRGAKTLQSDFGGGLERTVTLYGTTGDVIKTWRGRIDLADTEDEVWFDLDGKRVNINGGIVVVEEGE
jgi:hypothetical protein